MISQFRVDLPQIVAVCIKNIILVAFGMTLGFPTVLIPALQENPEINENDELTLNKAQISWISSINLICVPLGCIFSGSFTAWIGRRKAMQIVCLPIFAAWIIFYFSHDVLHLYIALCLSGFTGGMLEAPVLTYVAEISTPKLRGILAATGSFCIILGILTQFVMGSFIQWRTITLLSTIAPIMAIIFLFFVPESPHWLILKNREEEAKESLMWLRGWQKDFEVVRDEFEELHWNLTQGEASDEPKESLLKSFAKRTFIFPYLICSLAFFIGHFSGMTTLQTYAVPIFAQLKAPVDKYYATMLLGIVELVGTGTCVVLVRFLGKRKLTFFSTFGCSFCFFFTAVYAYYIDEIPGDIAPNNVISNVTVEIANILNQTEGTKAHINDYISVLQSAPIDLNETTTEAAIIVPDLHSNQHSWVPLTLLLASALLSHLGIRLLPWMLIGEVFPANIRGISSGLTGGTSYIFGFMANKLFLTMVAGLTLAGTFLLYSCISVVGCLILFVVLPETEGRTLKQIEDHFCGKKALPKLIKRKQTLGDIPFPPKFDVTKWNSNLKFEKRLEELKVNDQTHHVNFQDDPENSNKPQVAARKLNTESNRKNGVKVVVNENDYDTSL